MSVVIIALPGAPTLDEATQAADRECDERLRAYVTKEFKESPDIDPVSIVHAISVKEVEIAGLPPGGGIHTK